MLSTENLPPYGVITTLIIIGVVVFVFVPVFYWLKATSKSRLLKQLGDPGYPWNEEKFRNALLRFKKKDMVLEKQIFEKHVAWFVARYFSKNEMNTMDMECILRRLVHFFEDARSLQVWFMVFRSLVDTTIGIVKSKHDVPTVVSVKNLHFLKHEIAQFNANVHGSHMDTELKEIFDAIDAEIRDIIIRFNDVTLTPLVDEIKKKDCAAKIKAYIVFFSEVSRMIDEKTFDLFVREIGNLITACSGVSVIMNDPSLNKNVLMSNVDAIVYALYSSRKNFPSLLKESIGNLVHDAHAGKETISGTSNLKLLDDTLSGVRISHLVTPRVLKHGRKVYGLQNQIFNVTVPQN